MFDSLSSIKECETICMSLNKLGQRTNCLFIGTRCPTRVDYRFDQAYKQASIGLFMDERKPNLIKQRFSTASLPEKTGFNQMERSAPGCSSSLPSTASSKESTTSDDVSSQNEAKELMAKCRIKGQGNRLEDLIGLKKTNEAIKLNFLFPLRRPDLFAFQKPTNMLLYGVPGCGKSEVMKALASELEDYAFFAVSSADLMSEWFGKSEQRMRAIFQVARESAPSVIFFDELDALLTSRSHSNADPMIRRLQTEFFCQSDGLFTDSRTVVLIGATNTPQELDQAALRRFQTRIEVEMPTEKDREQFLSKSVGSIPNTLSIKDISDLSQSLHGYSFSDLNALCRDVRLAPFRNLSSAEVSR